jgi:hypothetical protein
VRKITRHAFTIVAALSLLVCVAIVALWVRSHFVYDAVADGWVNDPPTSGTFVQAYSNRGAISLRRLEVVVQGSTPPGFRVDRGIRLNIGPGEHWTTGKPLPWELTRFRYLMGFSCHNGSSSRPEMPGMTTIVHEAGVTLPHWFAALLAAVPAVIGWRQHRSHRMRERTGLCAKCGYDLRASPERCPECEAKTTA